MIVDKGHHPENQRIERTPHPKMLASSSPPLLDYESLTLPPQSLNHQLERVPGSRQKVEKFGETKHGFLKGLHYLKGLF